MAISGRIMSAALLFAAALAPCGAATVSVMVVEEGLAPKAAEPEASSAWESGIMDALFDAGHIVCNAPVFRVAPEADRPGSSWNPTDRDIADAVEGGVAYLFVAYLEYEAADGKDAAAVPGKTNPAIRPSPRRAGLRVYSLDPFALVEETKPKALDRTESGAEDQNQARAMARGLIQRLKDR